MVNEKIWEQAVWVAQARQLIEGIRKFPEQSKIIMILRHSHRDELKPDEIQRDL